jgi:hypothetical protein
MNVAALDFNAPLMRFIVPHIQPKDVVSPKASWRLIDVVLDRGEEDCAYAIGMWDDRRCVGFRWNGSDERPLGNPQSRGLPTWTVLDPALHPAVLRLVEQENPSKAQIAQAFVGRPIEDEEDAA